MSKYEEELEKRIEQLENLWFKDTEGLEAIKSSLNQVMNASKDIENLIVTLQDPNSSTNKHGEKAFEVIKEKIHSKFSNLTRRINAVGIVIDNIRSLNK